MPTRSVTNAGPSRAISRTREGSRKQGTQVNGNSGKEVESDSSGHGRNDGSDDEIVAELEYSFSILKGSKGKTGRIDRMLEKDKDKSYTVLPGRDACDRCYGRYRCVIKNKAKGLVCMSCGSLPCSFSTDPSVLRGRQYLADIHANVKETSESWKNGDFEDDQAPPAWAIRLLSKGDRLLSAFLRDNEGSFKSYGVRSIKQESSQQPTASDTRKSKLGETRRSKVHADSADHPSQEEDKDDENESQESDSDDDEENDEEDGEGSSDEDEEETEED